VPRRPDHVYYCADIRSEVSPVRLSYTQRERPCTITQAPVQASREIMLFLRSSGAAAPKTLLPLSVKIMQ